MVDLARWLGQQLDEDERVALKSVEQASVNLAGANAASVSVWRVVERPATGTFVATRDQWDRVTEVVPTYGGAHAEHIARHDPARVLREIDAKRGVVARYEFARHEAAAPDIGEEERKTRITSAAAFQSCALLVAAVYSDRPGYAEAIASVE